MISRKDNRNMRTTGQNLVAVTTSLAVGLGLTFAGVSLSDVPAQAQAASTVRSMATCNYTSNEPVLRQGDAGYAVRQAQCLLNKSMSGVDLVVDGAFGAVTTRAVRRFQDCTSFPVDGIVGPNTWDNLKYWAGRSVDLCRFCG
jgi:peptidoglycan hydrolase-like protein with peptidoglycan-binding domain